MAFGALAGGIIYQIVSPQLPFLIMIASMIPVLIILTFLVHEPEKKEE
jgi:hypothetical protein